MLTITRNGRDGSLTRVIITGTEHELAALKSSGLSILGRLGSIQNGEIRGSASRRDVEGLEAYAGRVNERQVSAAVPACASQSRRIELLETAKRLHLNHGASWVCTGTQIDRDSLDPSWEGELVCYVYEVAR